MSKVHGYYDVISHLSYFESSSKVSFSREQLLELVQQEMENRMVRDNLTRSNVNIDFSKRTPMHSYLGPLTARHAEEASKNLRFYNLKHALLGGYVPRNQLESLSSTDFAHYLHKVLECEEPLESYVKYVNVDRMPTDTVSSMNESPVPLAAKSCEQVQPVNTSGSSSVCRAQTSSNSAAHYTSSLAVMNTITKKAGESHVKKVVLCKLCKKRFSGPRRFTEFSNHMCMKA